METEKFVLNEIDKGAKNIKIPESISGRYLINKLIANRLIKNDAPDIVFLDDASITNHFTITEKGRLWLTKQGENL